MRDLGEGNDGNDLIGREDDERDIIVAGGSADVVVVVGWCSLGKLGDSRDCSDEGVGVLHGCFWLGEVG